MRVVLAVAVAVLLAGCSSDGPSSPEASPSTDSGTGSPSPAPQARPWVAEAVPVSFDGNLGTSAHGCVFPAGVCHTTDVTEDATDILVDRPGTNFTGLDLVITWTAQPPATASLNVGLMVMASCEGCNSTNYEEVAGPSPLHATVSGASVPLTPDHRVHVYIYNPQGLVHDPSVPGYALVSVDQAFHVEGTVSLLVPPAVH